MKRVCVFLNGTVNNGHVIGINDSIDLSLHELMIEIRRVFRNPQLQLLYTANGCQIKDCSLIRDDETLYVSKGENFIPPTSTLNSSFGINSSDWVKLNVGGTIFLTTRATLTHGDPKSMLAKMFDPNSRLSPGAVDSNGAYLIDRNPIYFGPILNFLRCGTLIIDEGVNPKGVAAEAQFFGIHLPPNSFVGQISIQDERNINATAQKTQINLMKELQKMSEKHMAFEGIKTKVETLKLKLGLREIYIKTKKMDLGYPQQGAELDAYQAMKKEIRDVCDSVDRLL